MLACAAIMSVLNQLGVNETLYIQIAIYLYAVFLLMFVVYRPYYKAFADRESKTVGSEESVETIRHQTQELQGRFENKARQINGEIKTIFDTYRDQAQKDQANLLSAAKAESEKILETARAKVSQDVSQAQAALKQEIPALVQSIQTKLLTK